MSFFRRSAGAIAVQAPDGISLRNVRACSKRRACQFVPNVSNRLHGFGKTFGRVLKTRPAEGSTERDCPAIPQTKLFINIADRLISIVSCLTNPKIPLRWLLGIASMKGWLHTEIDQLHLFIDSKLPHIIKIVIFWHSISGGCLPITWNAQACCFNFRSSLPVTLHFKSKIRSPN